MQETQGVADIAAPAQVPTGQGQQDAVFQSLAAQLNAPLPSPYTTGVQQQTPTVPQARTYTPIPDNNKPLTSSVADIKHARRQNSVAGLANMIGKFGQQYQDQKNTSLKNDITKVMQSKQNVENAQKVTQQAQMVLDDKTSTPQAIAQAQTQIRQAQGVMDLNKKNLQTIFADSKNRKGLEKAFDISYVDMEKNKTPEIAQALAAKKEFDAAGPLNYNNQAELQVAKAAGALSPDSAGAPKGDITGAPQAGPQTVAQQPTQAVAPQPKSQTPYADAALAKDMPTMENNPQYAAALAQKAVAQKQYMAALPTMVKADSDALLANAKAGNDQALAVFKDVNAANRANQLAVSRLNDVNADVAGKKAVAATKEAGATARTTAILASLEKRATQAAGSRETVAAIKGQTLEILQTEIGKATSDLNKANANILTAENMKSGPEKNAALASAQYDKDSAQRYLTMWQGKMDAAIGTKSPPATTGAPKVELEKPKMPGFFDKLGAAVTYFGAKKDAGATSTAGGNTAVSPVPSAQRTDPTDAEYAAALAAAQEVGPTDDSSVNDTEKDDEDSSKY